MPHDVPDNDEEYDFEIDKEYLISLLHKIEYLICKGYKYKTNLPIAFALQQNTTCSSIGNCNKIYSSCISFYFHRENKSCSIYCNGLEIWRGSNNQWNPTSMDDERELVINKINTLEEIYSTYTHDCLSTASTSLEKLQHGPATVGEFLNKYFHLPALGLGFFGIIILNLFGLMATIGFVSCSVILCYIHHRRSQARLSPPPTYDVLMASKDEELEKLDNEIRRLERS